MKYVLLAALTVSVAAGLSTIWSLAADLATQQSDAGVAAGFVLVVVGTVLTLVLTAKVWKKFFPKKKQHTTRKEK